MAHEYRRKESNLAHYWITCGKLLVAHIRNLKFGRPSEICDESYKKYRMMYDMTQAYANQPSFSVSPFILVSNDSYIASNISILAISNQYLEDLSCEETGCLTSEEIEKLNDNLNELAKTMNYGR